MTLWVFVDVDGTLVDHLDNPRPYVRKFFYSLKEELGCRVIVWSAGGHDYANRKIGMISRKIQKDLNPFIDAYMWKADSDKIVEANPQFYIDDVEDLIEAKIQKGHGGFKVPFYCDPTVASIANKNDQWLLKAIVAVQEYQRAHEKSD